MSEEHTNEDKTKTEETKAPIDAKAGVTAFLQNFETMQEELKELHTLTKRRFDELSMEINATSQQVNMSEEHIGEKFTEVFETLGAISYKGDGSTAANTGVELDAVVDMTEEAANKILDAAGRIGGYVKAEEGWEKDDTRMLYLDMINGCVEEIFLACSFQDITGQRIRKTLENIAVIEQRLDEALDKLGVQVDRTPTDLSAGAASQDDIDALFAGGDDVVPAGDEEDNQAA